MKYDKIKKSFNYWQELNHKSINRYNRARKLFVKLYGVYPNGFILSADYIGIEWEKSNVINN